MSEKDGGPAFPFVEPSEYRDFGTGMTLRDWFAGMALQGWLAGTAPDFEPVEFTGHIAKSAYILADAMLLARKESQS